MRTRRISQYAERIERVVKHIEGLGVGETPPSLEALAKVAAISPFHFHRVFRLMTGETVLDCIRRVLLARAMAAIKEEGRTLEDAAEASGYSSGQAFARSLKRFARASAGELRADPAKMAAFEEKVMGPVRCAGEGSRAMEAQDGDASAGTRWEQAPEGPCLSAHHVGDYGGLLETIDGLYAVALTGGMELRDAQLFTHYLDDPEETPEAELRTDVYLPVVVKAVDKDA